VHQKQPPANVAVASFAGASSARAASLPFIAIMQTPARHATSNWSFHAIHILAMRIVGETPGSTTNRSGFSAHAPA